MTLQKGDRVRIIGGSYKKHGTGTFVKLRGITQAKVEVDGDTRSTRNLWLTSIQKIEMQTPKETTTTTTITINKAEYEEVLKQVETLEDEVKQLHLKLKRLGI